MEAKRNCPLCEEEMGVIQDAIFHCGRCQISMPISTEEGGVKTNPPLLQQALNFAKSTAKHVRNGMKKVSPDTLRKRLEICRNCDRLNKDRCSECGCFVSVKAAWQSEDCPLNKWGSEINRVNLGRKPGKSGCGSCRKKRQKLD